MVGMSLVSILGYEVHAMVELPEIIAVSLLLWQSIGEWLHWRRESNQVKRLAFGPL